MSIREDGEGLSSLRSNRPLLTKDLPPSEAGDAPFPCTYLHLVKAANSGSSRAMLLLNLVIMVQESLSLKVYPSFMLPFRFHVRFANVRHRKKEYVANYLKRKAINYLGFKLLKSIFHLSR